MGWTELLVLLAWLSGAALLLWIAVAFNRLVRHRNLVKEAWSGIDVQLERRHDLVPALVESVKGLADFESDLLERVTRLRARAVAGGPELRELQHGENRLAAQVRTLFGVAEDYPELTADRAFLRLQEQLVEIEDKLQLARRYYNGTVRDHNIRVESFPSNLVARLFGFAPRQFFEVESAAEGKAVPVDLSEESPP